MSELFKSRLLIAAPQGTADKLRGILASAGIVPDAVCLTGGEALEALGEGEAVLLTAYRLSDMTGEELSEKAGDTAGVLMIVPQDYELSAGDNILPLYNPITPDALVQAVRAMLFCGRRVHAMQEKVSRLSRTLEERKIIERAKGRLMDTLQIKEAEAHYRIQKKSMDTGRRIVDIAQEILDAGEIAAS